MQRQLEELVKYCNETKVEGGLLARNQIIRNRLAEIACEIEADRTLAYRIADLQSRNAMVGFDASIVKVFTGELLERLSFLGAELLGPYGQIKFSRWAPQNGAWEKACQESFVFTIAMGTDEIQKNIMAWYGLGLPRMF
jgi:alkylation response protein AidB-like acyl-CoA dehydrogenase